MCVAEGVCVCMCIVVYVTDCVCRWCVCVCVRARALFLSLLFVCLSQCLSACVPACLHTVWLFLLPITAQCQDYPLSLSGFISSLELCQPSPDDPKKYPNNAEWSFSYSNSQTNISWFNVQYEIDLEACGGCGCDSLSFDSPELPDHVIVCGFQTGELSREHHVNFISAVTS